LKMERNQNKLMMSLLWIQRCSTTLGSNLV
jgi:hypothetical protein